MKVRRFSTRMSLLGCMLLCTLALVVSGLALPGCYGGSGTTGERLVEIKLMWDSSGDVDLHLWRPAGNQCSNNGCSASYGLSFSGNNNDTGPEVISIYDSADAGLYRVGVNLYGLNGPNPSNEWLVYIIVTTYPDDPDDSPRKEVTGYGAYKLTTPIANGGYPVSVDTDSWWRPIDILIGSPPTKEVSLEVADHAPMNK